MKDFEQAEAKKAWSEPQMTQLGVKETASGPSEWLQETNYAQNNEPATHS